jgi:glycosidase
MGVNLLWLLPFFEHGDGKKWNLYSPFDHFKISSLYGTVDELKSMLDACKEAGIQVIFDFVPHGPPDESELGRNHLDWVCLDEAGKPIYVWSQLAFDNANPGWQEYMRKAAEYNAREYGIVGARIDVATGSPPNWRSGTGYRPSFSTLGGGLGMCRAIREGLRRVHRNVVILPEEYTASRIYYRVADLTYDASLFLVLIDLQIRQATPTEWAETLQCFLHDQSLTLPRGALKMRWIANHDTVSWTIKKERPRKTFGFERARALIGLCCLIDGVPMIYQGEEDPSIYGGTGPSIVDYLAKLLNCRKRLPSLTSRVTDYQSVQATNGVFTCVRGSGRERTIVMVSLNPENVNSSLQLPSDLQDMSWKDELTGERINPSNVSMDGHQIRILVSAG